MPRAEEPVFDELPEYLVIERKKLETFHKSTVEEPYHEFLVEFPLQSSYLLGIETLHVTAEKLLGLSDKENKKAWRKAPSTKFSYTTLHEVVRSGDLKTLQLIAESYPVDLNVQSRSGRTALHYAVLMGLDEIIEFLLSRNVDVSIIDNLGCNVLHLAVAHNRESLAKALLTLGLDFQQKNNAGHRPLEIMALNVLGYKSSNLYKHLIKLIIKKQTGIVERWLKDLYSCGIFEMLISPREMSGAQLLDLQDINSGLFLTKWKNLQLVMDPDFKSIGRTTLPGQGFRDERPSSLINGRFLELWSKYYDSLKLGCKPEIICKFSKKTEPDTVHLKYEIKGVRKGRYDPEFIDVGLMVVFLKDDLILKEDVDPDTSVEQPIVVKPTSSGGAEKLKQAKKVNKRSNNAILDESSEDDEELDELYIVEQEIRSIIEIIEIIDQMTNSVEENSAKLVCETKLDSNDAVTFNLIVSDLEQTMQKPASFCENFELFSDFNVSFVAAFVVESIITKIERNAEAMLEPTMDTLEPEMVSRETGNHEIQTNSARWLREGPIVDLRSLPWETLASSCLEFATTSSGNQHSENISGENISDIQHNASSQSKIMVSSAFNDENVRNAIEDAVELIGHVNMVKSQSSSE
jgi:hypothetical protein